MTYIFIGTVLIFILFAIISAKSQLSEDNNNKVYTSVSGLMCFAILLSILQSVLIALEADMKDDIGFGGFDYIIVPTICGIFILAIYLVSIDRKPNLKYKLGVIGVFINVIVGIIYFFN